MLFSNAVVAVALVSGAAFVFLLVFVFAAFVFLLVFVFAAFVFVFDALLDWPCDCWPCWLC